MLPVVFSVFKIFSISPSILMLKEIYSLKIMIHFVTYIHFLSSCLYVHLSSFPLPSGNYHSGSEFLFFFFFFLLFNEASKDLISRVIKSLPFQIYLV